MDRASSERWVVISAAIVAGIYAYRRVLNPGTPKAGSSVKRIAGLGEPVPLGAFVTAWGFVFLTVSIMASASPGLGGSFAILIATSDLLTNAAGAGGIFTVVQQQETPNAATTKKPTTGKVKK